MLEHRPNAFYWELSDPRRFRAASDGPVDHARYPHLLDLALNSDGVGPGLGSSRYESEGNSLGGRWPCHGRLRLSVVPMLLHQPQDLMDAVTCLEP